VSWRRIRGEWRGNAALVNWSINQRGIRLVYLLLYQVAHSSSSSVRNSLELEIDHIGFPYYVKVSTLHFHPPLKLQSDHCHLLQAEPRPIMPAVIDISPLKDAAQFPDESHVPSFAPQLDATRHSAFAACFFQVALPS